MSHARKVLVRTLAFFVLFTIVVGLASGSWHLGLHGACYVSLAFAMWLDARYSCRS
ncbi:MAG: hypothetical protein JST00_31525 [Deltaproteobacteria bacterium]|nr:hypothetical protein [Deltaproteobacteria bacterium]